MSLLDIMGSYRPQRSCGKVMFLHLSVILSMGGVCSSACWDTHTQTPPRQTPPLGRHPLGRPPLPSACWDTHPLAQCILGYTPPCPVHSKIHMAIAADGTHPTGMHSCYWIELYWNVCYVMWLCGVMVRTTPEHATLWSPNQTRKFRGKII